VNLKRSSRQPKLDEGKNRESSDEENDRDPTELHLNPEHIVDALNYFYETREKLAVDDGMNQSIKKKKSTFESEEQKNERERRKQ
jgi:hypothetical protein